VDEETGLTGAFALGADMLDGRIMLNLDSEEDWIITVGCAGGGDGTITFPLGRDRPAGEGLPESSTPTLASSLETRTLFRAFCNASTVPDGTRPSPVTSLKPARPDGGPVPSTGSSAPAQISTISTVPKRSDRLPTTPRSKADRPARWARDAGATR